MCDYTNKKINFANSKIQAKITKRISLSNQNQVYQCINAINLNQYYCLKIITSRNDDKRTLGIINTEIYLLLNLKTAQNLVHLIDYFTLDNGTCTTCFILMEYCQNGTLEDKLKKLNTERNSFSETQIWNIITKIGIGLSHIHKLKYAHRDLVPENILIDYDDTNFKLCDFGSASNQIIDNFSNSTRNEIIFFQNRNHNQHYQAPEMLDLYSNYPITEKVDIWSLGLILYSLMFDFLPFSNDIKFITGKTLFLTDEMENAYSCKLISLLKMMIVQNPIERASITQVLTYIENNNSFFTPMNIDLKKLSVSFKQKIKDVNAKLFKRHSTQFWVLKLINQSINTYPKFKYLKFLIMKAWTKKNKIVKFYKSISNGPIHYFSIAALKSIYVIHHYIFLGPCETLNPIQFNLEEFIDFFHQVWTTRYTNNSYEAEDNFTNCYLAKFIISYSEFLKNKVYYHKKYPMIENNYSLNNKIIDYISLIDKNFIIDTLKFYSQIYQKFIQIPLMLKQLNSTLDVICQLFNEELSSIFSLLFYVMIAYKKNNSNCIDINQIKLYDSHFIEITKKTNEYLLKLKKTREEMSSQKSVELLSYTTPIEYMQTVNNSVRAFRNNFSLKNHFLTKEIAGISLSKNTGALVFQNVLDEFYTLNGGKKEKENFNFNFSDDKFQNSRTDFDFDLASTSSRKNNFNIPQTQKMRSLSRDQMNSNNFFNQNFFSKENNKHVEKETIVDLNQELNSIFQSNASTSNQNNQINYNFPINLINLSQKKPNPNYKQNLFKQTPTYMNNYSIGLSGMNKQPIQIIRNTPINFSNSNNTNSSGSSSQNEKFETPKADISNISIFNINYNNYNVVKQVNNNTTENLAKMASDLLKDEFTKPHYQWLISSKSIQLLRTIGIGGSSEVYLGDYRGTEVAVKKLRILDYREENLKEFKREVSSLIMLRHPNLVLFMGAMYIYKYNFT